MNYFSCKTTGLLSLILMLAGTLPAEPEDRHSTEYLRSQLDVVQDFRYKDEIGEGMKLADEVLAIAREDKNDELVNEAIYQIALLHYFQEDYDAARANLEVGYNETKRLKMTSLQADFLGALGVLEWKLGNLAVAQSHMVDTLALFEELEQPVSMASTANNLGIIAFALKNYPEASDWYIRGLAFLADNKKDRLRASLLSNLAEVLIPSGRLDEAEEYLQQSLDIELELNDQRNLAYTYFNFGELRAKQNKPDEALELYRKALDMQIEVDDPWASAGTRLEMAEEYLKLGNPEAALEVLETAFSAARELNALALLRDAAGLLSRAYAETGNTGLATYYHDLEGWFTSRTTETKVLVGDPSGNRTIPASNISNAKVVNEQSSQLPFRTAAIIILCMMIGLLILENIRLRKQAGQM